MALFEIGKVYLWDEPVVLDGPKLRRTLPDFTVTPLEEAIAASLGPIVPGLLSSV